MKKMFGVFIFGMFLISMMGIASAGPFEDFVKGVNTVGNGIYNILEPVLEIITGENAGPGVIGEVFLAKILFLVIIFAIVWIILSGMNFFGDGWALWTVSAAVSILAVRWFGGLEIVQTAILPYSALGIAIVAGLPFVLAFIIIETKLEPKAVRKFAWIFFVIIFIGLWFARYEEIRGDFVYIYLIVAGLGLVMMWMDGTIQRWLNQMKREKTLSPGVRKQVVKLEEERELINIRYTEKGNAYTGIYSKKTGLAGWKYDVDNIDKRIAHLERQL